MSYHQKTTPEPKYTIQQTEQGTQKIFMIGERLKLIGEITGDTLVIHKKSKDIFRKGNAVGISNKILTTEKLNYAFVEYRIEGKTYKTTRVNFIANGFFLHFSGYEIQKFLPLSQFNKDLTEVIL